MSEEWEEASLAKQYLDSCPSICRNCRWLDWYYEMGCSQMAYPVEGKCMLYTHQRWFKMLLFFEGHKNYIGKQRGVDVHYHLWRFRTWLYSFIGLKPNIVGSWRQWEYTKEDHDWEYEE